MISVIQPQCQSIGKHSVYPSNNGNSSGTYFTTKWCDVHDTMPAHTEKKKKPIYMCCFYQRTHAHKDKHTIKANKSVLGCSREPHFKTLFLLSLLDMQHLGLQFCFLPCAYTNNCLRYFFVCVCACVCVSSGCACESRAQLTTSILWQPAAKVEWFELRGEMA